MKNNKPIKIAIQKKGRLRENSIAFLSSLGIECTESGKKLFAICPNTGIEILFVRDDDIPEYVTRGVADFGIVGKNVLLEKQVKIDIIENLGFSKCKLVLAVPNNSQIQNIKELEGERIATSFPNSLQSFLKQKNINAAIIKVEGSVEITPSINLADAICDITQSGKTLKDNDLRQLETIFESEAVLIKSLMCTKNLSKLTTQL